ncbi:histidine kinase dimerization/phosphoacceptor domain -containing protein [Xanthomarina sp. F2636L]|uniref:tetratricopeptide repeat-containing sensor histidine kinase n=1 Tax=Xanthomarina sp. F2636L TaxID=2996018 RepID=UPI00225E66EE|nr:histidine kinase dimerization/phosphoacceptor domain -containing protein [Xanthomarina sp. F2636L]MCX7551636.1 tetratricopeptide repeat protein [Xanthomarina sp. F2636L]
MSLRTLFIFLSITFTSFTIIAQSKTDVINKAIDSIFNSVENVSLVEDKVKLLNTKSGEYRYTKNSLKLVNKAIDLSKEAKNNKLLAMSYYSLGNYYFYNTRLDSAMIYFDKSNNILKDLDLPTLKASVLISKSGIYRKNGNSSKAISTLLESKKILDKIDTLALNQEQREKYKGKNLVLNNTLANYYNQMEEYSKALVYYDLAIASALQLGSQVNAGIIMANKGDLLLKMGEFEKALDLQEEAKKNKEAGNAPQRTIINSDLNLGHVHLKLNHYDKALTYLNNAYSFYEKENNQRKLYEVLLYRGNLYLELNNTKLAAQDCEASKQLAIQQNDIEFITEACECLYKTYKSSGAFDLALLNHEDYLKAKDSVFNAANVKKQTQLEMQYEFDKKEELQKLSLEAKERESQLYSYLAFAGLLIASSLGFFFYKNQRKNKLLARQKVLLEASIDEKNILLKETHHRVKNSFQIVSSLLYLQSENMEDKEAKIAIQEAQNRVRSMVLIHQKLYNKDQLVGINTEEYFNDLVKDIFESHQFQEQAIRYKLQVEPIILDVETITPIGLILNELIINSIKHAFEKVTDKSLLTILFTQEDKALVLKVIDNGKGFSGEVKDSSFGIKLMKALSKKLRAEIHYKSDKQKGTEATLIVKKFNIL